MPKKPKAPPSELIMEGWAASLDAKILKRFGVETKTGLNIMTMDMVTDFPRDEDGNPTLDTQSLMMIRTFIEGWSFGTLRAQFILRIHEGTASTADLDEL